LTTAIIGVGSIGGALARHLVAGGEPVVLASKDESRAEALAQELGPLAHAASVEDAIAGADAVVFALWLDTIKELIPQHARLLENKVVVDPANPIGFDETGQFRRTLPDDRSAASVVAALLPASARYVKAAGGRRRRRPTDRGTRRRPRSVRPERRAPRPRPGARRPRIVRGCCHEPTDPSAMPDYAPVPQSALGRL
jgi:8-hydroxy-5-deazaflavin:NADPH oxidoreductase